MPDNQPDIADILSAAVEIDSPAARETYVEQACRGDAALKARVAELVRMHFLAGDFLERPAPEVAETLLGPRSLLKIGTQVGPYKLLQEIGDGGMGVVYMAQQDRPVQRRVALKVIKPGMDTRQVIARFEAERQALAMMDHPNIARVFDAGMTETGRPYFVMELINGVPITRYCDEQHLTPIERLRLFLPVCHAVQHAHQKGIIHRDLKPSNVLVAQYDDLAVPKVIDFGVAKATSQQLTDLTLFTEFGQVMGTFEYMSPEQARRNQLDVDTRTDVYSLGVILYELLTGGTPFDATRFRQAAIDEILRIIGDEEPPRPSLKLSGSHALPSIAANRRLEPGRLSRFVEGDLDWIVMRTLEKDRARRYATVGSLAADVQRFLNDEPVEAGPPSATYRFRKFARRNTGVFVSVSLMALLLLLGTVISTWQAIRATRAERRAEQLAELATRSAVVAGDARDRAEAQRLLAESREIEARQSQYGTNLLMARDAVERNDPEKARQRLNLELPDVGRLDVRTFGWYFLQAQLDREQGILRGHDGHVTGVAYSPDGRTLATAGADWTIRLWDTVLPAGARVLQGHEHAVNSVVFSPDGSLLASVSDDQTARLWDSATGDMLAVLTGHRGHVRGVAFSPDGTFLATAGTDTTIKLWNVADAQLIGQMTGHQAEINQVAFSPDGNRLASCADDESVRIWDVAAREQVAILSGHRGHVRSVAYSPDGKLIASGGRDATVRLWNAQQNVEIKALEGHTAGVQDAVFSPDGTTLASVGEDRAVRFWDVDVGQLMLSRIGHGSPVYAVNFAPDGRSLATGGFDRTIRIWKAPDPHRSILPAHTCPVYSVAISPDGRWLAAGGADSLVRLWDAATGLEVHALEGHKLGLHALAFSPDGQILASGDGRGIVRLWDPETGEARSVLQTHKAVVRQLAFSGDGQLLASCSDDEKIGVWRMPDGEPVAMLEGHTAAVNAVAFVPERDELVSAGSDGVLRIWDLESGQTIGLLEGSNGIGNSVAVSPDGSLIASGSHDGEVNVWDAVSHQPLAKLHGHSMQVQTLVFSPDGAYLVTGSNDKSIRLWDIQTRLDITSFTGHTGQVNCIALSRDGKHLASAAGDATVRLWEIPTAPGWEFRPRLPSRGLLLDED